MRKEYLRPDGTPLVERPQPNPDRAIQELIDQLESGKKFLRVDRGYINVDSIREISIEDRKGKTCLVICSDSSELVEYTIQI